MIQFILKLLAGPLVGAITGVINKHFEKQMNQDVLKADLLKAILETGKDVGETNAKVIEAEIKSERWIVATWRPIVALSFAFTLLAYALIFPCLNAWFGVPVPRVGDILLGWIYTTATVCITGYGAGRSVEKVAEIVAGMWRR